MEDLELDQSTFSGRFNTMLRMINPLQAFYSNKQIKEFQQLINDQKEIEQNLKATTGSPKTMLTQEEIRRLRIAKYVCGTAIN